jgi:hypothetical protein
LFFYGNLAISSQIFLYLSDGRKLSYLGKDIHQEPRALARSQETLRSTCDPARDPVTAAFTLGLEVLTNAV